MFGSGGISRGGNEAYFFEDVQQMTGDTRRVFERTLGLDDTCGFTRNSSGVPVELEALMVGEIALRAEIVSERTCSALKAKVVQEDTPMRHLTPAEIGKFRELVEAGRETE